MSLTIENVWIAADRGSHDLGEVWPGRPPALLPIAGRALIEYVMDELFEAKITRATVALSAEVAACRELLAGGARWGVELREALTRGKTTRRRIFADGSAGGGPTSGGAADPHQLALVVYADRFRTPAVASFLKLAGRLGPRRVDRELAIRPGSIVAVGEDGRPLGIELICGNGGPRRTLVIPKTCSFDVGTADGILAAHLAAVTGLIPVALHAQEIEDGVWIGRQVQVAEDVTFHAPVFVGPGCEIGKGAVVGPHAFLGPNCFLEPAARIENAALLEHTFAGPGAEIVDAVANGKVATPVACGLVARERSADGRPGGPQLSRDLSRLDATAALQWLSSRCLRTTLGVAILVAMPLLLLWYVLAVITKPTAPLRHRVLRSNRPSKKIFHAFEATAWPGWRRLPWLLAVVTGDLDLVGVRPHDAESGAVEPGEAPRPWRQEIVGTARAGLISPAILMPDATPMAQDLAEAAWLADRTWRSDVGLIATAVLRSLDLRRGFFPPAARTSAGAHGAGSAS
ncbi:MAG: hypothetical protein AAGM22_06410 [Acidobacteriota bacterium]